LFGIKEIQVIFRISAPSISVWKYYISEGKNLLTIKQMQVHLYLFYSNWQQHFCSSVFLWLPVIAIFYLLKLLCSTWRRSST